MDSIQLWARDGEAVRQAIELGEIAHIETASEELTEGRSSPPILLAPLQELDES